MENKHFQEIVENIRRMPNVANTKKEYGEIVKQRLGSLVLLYMEHLRRGLRYMNKFKLEGGYGDIYSLLFRYLDSNDIEYPYELLMDYVDELALKVSLGEGRYTLYLYLSWHFNKEQIDKRGFNTIPDPIEPLWVFLLRGGYIRTEQGFVTVSDYMVRIPNYISSAKGAKLLNKVKPFIDCYNEAALDLADKELLTDREAFLKKYVYEYV